MSDQTGGANRRPTKDELFERGKSKNKKIYYGLARPLRSDERRPTMREAVQSGNISYYGLFKADPMIILKGMHAKKSESKADVLRIWSRANGKVLGLTKKLKNPTLPDAEKAKVQKELEEAKKTREVYGAKYKAMDPSYKDEPKEDEAVKKFKEILATLDDTDYNKLMAEVDDLEAEGKKLIKRKQRGKGVLTDLVPTQYNPTVKKFIEDHSEWLITNIVIARKPIEESHLKLLNLMSLGRLKSNQNAIM